MGLVNKIKEDSIAARKNAVKEDLRSNTIAVFLVTLYAEIVAVGKNKGNRETTDDEAISVIKKFIENNKVMAQYANDHMRKVQEIELEVLKGYMPEMISEETLRAEIQSLISGIENPSAKNIGQVMGALKKKFGSAYDAKLASEIVKNSF